MDIKEKIYIILQDVLEVKVGNKIKDERNTQTYIYYTEICNYLLMILAIMRFEEIGLKDEAHEIVKNSCEDCYNDAIEFLNALDQVELPECCIKKYKESNVFYDIKYLKALTFFAQLHEQNVEDNLMFYNYLHSGFKFLIKIFNDNGLEWK